MKSLAHPEWPYAGTAHEWRGFVKSDDKPVTRIDDMLAKALEDARTQIPSEEITYTEMMENLAHARAVYQKQNFGPDLK